MGIFDPQGLPSSPTSQSITNSGIASWAQPYVMNYLNQGNNLLNASTTPLQNQVYQSAGSMQRPEQFALGSSLANRSGEGQLSTAPMALNYGQMGAATGAQGIGIGQAGMNYGMNAGQNYANQATNPGAVGAYMNPFIQQALAPQLQLLNQQQALGAQKIAGQSAGQGAFGGNRATLAQGLNAQNYALAGQQAIGQGYTDAFKQAQQAQQFGANLGLQGAMQGTAAGLSGLDTALKGTGLGLQGVQGAQQGYTGATQAGAALGNIGAQQGQYDLAALELQNKIANQQYNLPFQKLNFMQGLMSGLPVSSSTTQGYQAGPNKLSQLTGAVGALGSYAPGAFDYAKDLYKRWNTNSDINAANDLMSQVNTGQVAADAGGSYYAPLPGYTGYGDSDYAEGGQVKRYAEGGITAINRKVMNDPTAYSEDTVNRSAQNNVLGGVTKLLALDTIAKQRAAMQAQQAMQQQPSPSVMAQLQQQMAPGIDNAESNLPQQYAGGGIIAFEEGGTAKSDERFPEKIQDLPAYLRKRSPGIDKFLNAFNFNNIREQVNQGTNAPVVAPEPAPTDAQPDSLGRYKAGTDNSGIVIHPNAPAAPTRPSAPQAYQAPAPKDYGTAGIDELTKSYESMIRGGEDFKKAESDADRSAFRKTMLGMMAGESPYFFTNLGKSGLAAQEGLDKTLEGVQARKDKQITQLMGLGLKGQDLKNEARKLGIADAELEAKIPLYAAQAKYYGAKGTGLGAGISAGSIGAKDYFARRDMYKSFALNPKANPELFAGLPKDVRDALGTKPGSPSYQRGLDAVKLIADRMLAQDVAEARSVGAKKVPLSSIDD